ncbi:hypothetical protein NDI76_05820 [Halogeometricum sp. S1BR25-6]|uniref:DUF7344 domain-containing protein n=1 Tax=Halogeometricum salsisoli TaxID=2950536 RepID=A0ABU2GBT4_9EURY|nr:hypothetical protein [Halogeometricum sp. S1BR25-6]MDS0298252.1 hypothetical protein [Halogeometricum sp. S1BR25-6]
MESDTERSRSDDPRLPSPADYGAHSYHREEALREGLLVSPLESRHLAKIATTCPPIASIRVPAKPSRAAVVTFRVKFPLLSRVAATSTSETTMTSMNASAVDTVTVYNLLKMPRRRQVLHVLLQCETPVSLDTVAKRVEEQEHLHPSEMPRFPEMQIARTLHHSHLPRLDEAGVIDYDATEQEVVSFNSERFDALLASGNRVLASLRDDRFDTER